MAVNANRVWDAFEALRKRRGDNALPLLKAVGATVTDTLGCLGGSYQRVPIEWRGEGDKTFFVFGHPTQPSTFSRAANSELFLEATEFEIAWNTFLRGLSTAASDERLAVEGVPGEVIDQALYTAAISFAALNDLERPGNRGSAGTYFEIIVGAAVQMLLRQPMGGAVSVRLPDADTVERIAVDISFPPNSAKVALIIPTKITTRERISQAYVHQRILQAAGEETGVTYRSALVACSENNVLAAKGLTRTQRTPDRCWLVDTLVPGTISLYHRYVAQLERLYYVDPPSKYLKLGDGTAANGFPQVEHVQSLFMGDLEALLAR